MHGDIISVGLGFIEGLGLIFSPCILPILPIILSGSLTGSVKRPLGIITGFVIIFGLFTFFSRALVQHSGIDLTAVRYASYILLFIFGLIMLSTYLTEKFARLTRSLNTVGSSSKLNNEGFFNGLLFGGLVAIIWTPCAGPILAAVIVQVVIQQSSLTGLFIMLAFALGAGLPMLAIALLGRRIMERMTFFKKHSIAIRKLLGVVIIATVSYLIFSEGIGVGVASSTSESYGSSLQNGLDTPYPAPKIEGISAWINSSPITLSQLKGKVVLIDFWDYSCINCIRTLPYIKSWWNKYHNKGLVIIGVHSPEFDFEKSLDNLKNAVNKDGIQYPVALDNQFVTWRNFENQYWPAHYLIDKNGMVVYQHFGEGDYDVTENNIRYLLGIKGAANSENDVNAAEEIYSSITPETYLGYERAANFGNSQELQPNKISFFTFPEELSDNHWALQGSWLVQSDKIVSSSPNASLKINFKAKHVYMVMGSVGDKPLKLKVLLNGEPVSSTAGRDVVNSEITVSKHILYNVLDLKNSDSGILQIIPQEPGLEIFTFTFG